MAKKIFTAETQRTQRKQFVLSLCALCASAVTIVLPLRAEVPALVEHPAHEQLEAILESPKPVDFKASGMSRKDYLPLIAGDVDYWKHFQNAEGAIVDPYEKKERQYSTPAFALASAILVKEAGRKDLLDASTRAMSFATAALANHTTADFHADFYIPMLMHARRILRDQVDPAVAKKWDEEFASIVPEKIYHDYKGGGNWNIVNVSGELLRRKDGLVPADKANAQMQYIERCLKTQQGRFTKFGMYEDPNQPLAYDAFPRLWLEDMVADGAAPKDWQEPLETFLMKGGLSGLMLLSPSGEWACGGRSAQHQWNEAENCVIDEVNAARWHKLGRDDIAGSFKRAAHLALTSMKRWQRPSGEMWIVKNFADPARRFGYEGYSFNTQYNLLPMGMLAIAYERADDAIAEMPTPAENANYVFDVREPFRVIVAACGGYYIEVDTTADEHYNGTGFQRVHRVGVALSPLSDSAAKDREIGPVDEKIKESVTPGIEWKDASGEWISLASFGVKGHELPPSRAGKKAPPEEKMYVKNTDVKISENSAKRVAFTITYELSDETAPVVEEDYVISSDGVEGSTRLIWGKSHEQDAHATRAVFPALVNDGARDTGLSIEGNILRITRKGAPLYKSGQENPGGSLEWQVVAPAEVNLSRTGPELVTHNGYVQRVVGGLPMGANEVKWKLKLN